MCSWFGKAVPGDRYQSLHPVLWNAKKGILSGRWEERAGTCHCWAVCFVPLGALENDPFRRNESKVQRGNLWSVKQWTVPAQHTQTGWWLCASTTLSLVGKENLADKHKGIKRNRGNLHTFALMANRWGAALHTDMMIFRVLRYFLNNYHPQALNCWGDINCTLPHLGIITGQHTRLRFMSRQDVSSAELLWLPRSACLDVKGTGSSWWLWESQNHKITKTEKTSETESNQQPHVHD